MDRKLRWLQLEAKAASGDTSVRVDLFIARLENSKLTSEEGKKELAGLDVGDRKARIDALILTLEVRETLSKARTPEARAEAGKTFLGWHRAGKSPSEDGWLAFGNAILTYAEQAKDARVYEEILGILREKLSEPAYKTWLEARAKVLEGLKK
jgi:hypothetical protein